MSRRRSVRLPLRAFLPLTALSFWVACSSDETDFFGDPHHGGASGTKSTGGAAAVAGATSARGGAGGNGGSVAGAAPSGGSGARGGSAPDAGTNSTGGAPLAGEGNGASSGTGGTATGGSSMGGTSSSAGGMSGEAGAVDTAGSGGMSGAAAGDAGGGSGGTSAGAGAGGTAGGGMGGLAGLGGTAGGGMAGTTSTMSCGTNDDCNSNEYCKKTGCDAPWGVCAPRPPHCMGPDAELTPVCGCDHMTYYTPCVAAHEGVNVSASGECGAGAATCTRAGGGGSCSPKHDRAACFRERTSCSGSSPANGVCWVLPDTCPSEPAENYYCNVGGTPQCLGFCDGLESNVPLMLKATSYCP